MSGAFDQHYIDVVDRALAEAADALYEADFWVDDSVTAREAADLVALKFLRALPGSQLVPLYAAIKESRRQRLT